jgi:hypothetical protein
MHRRLSFALLLPALAALAACERAPDAPAQAQRISLEAARQVPAPPLLSPDTKQASWSVAANGQSIAFGNPAEPPLLSLACQLREQPARLEIVRHAPARPGAQALFPVLGNGMISRFKLDAALAAGEWRWQGALPASDPQLDVFTGPNNLEATLPGGGTLLIGGSRIPGEFVRWCRQGGRVQRAEAREQAAEAAGTAPEPPSTPRPDPAVGR